MRILICSILAMLAGILIGAYSGYRYYDKHVGRYATHELLTYNESVVEGMANIAVRAIDLIDCNDTNKAVQVLSQPIADYYYRYAKLGGTAAEINGRELISQLLSTNKTVADEITHLKTHYELHGPAQ